MSGARTAPVRAGVIAAAMLCAVVGSAVAANPPTGLDALPNAAAPTDELPARARAREPRGNPLWAIPLSALTVTRERPLFLPSRRPPVAPAVAGPPIAAPVMPVEEPRPQLTLVGAVAGESEGIAVFIDLNSNAMVRLRTGQDHAGWTLTSVKGREAILAKDKDTVSFALPAPGMSAGAAIPPIPGISGAPEGAALAAADGEAGVLVRPKEGENFVPYIPRKPPKNGEHDGL